MVCRYCVFLCWHCLCIRLQVTTNKGKRMTNYEKTKQEHIKITNAYQAGKEDGSAYEKACGQREWVGLTDEEIEKCIALANPIAIFEEVEAKLKEKNT